MKNPQNMTQYFKSIAVILAIFAFTTSQGQNPMDVAARQRTLLYSSYAFDPDSLQGFDEMAAQSAAVSEGYLGAELKVKMYMFKREFINNKYNLVPKKTVKQSTGVNNPNQAPSFLVPACTNEDFEASTAGNVIDSMQISGWKIKGGTVPGSGFCTLAGCCPTQPNQGALINCPGTTGFIDPVIGAVYPVYSVFGDVPNPNNGAGVNPQITIPMKGTKVIRINNSVNNWSYERLTKTFNVTPNSALFQFAFMSVFSTGHGCCSASAFKILVSIGNNPPLSCPQFSVAAPSTQCTTVTPMPYYAPGSGAPYNTSLQYAFSKWYINSIDLSGYIGQNVTLDIVVADCDAGGHYGYVYFDAQCSPMQIVGNGNTFPAGTPSITLPTCGASGATITAPSGLGPYSWNSSNITIPSNMTVPSQTNITLVTNQSGTVQLTMNPPGSCVPINKLITVTITPAPIVVASATQSGCTNTLSAASITCAGSASVNPVITWNPMPGTLSTNSLNATALPVGVTTITVTDPLGCKATATLNILPTPPPVTVAVNNLTGSYTISCFNPTINLQAVSNYTYGTLSYSWSSISFTANTATVGISAPNSLTLTAVDPATGCNMVIPVTVGINTTAPTNSVNPTSQVITCNSGAPVTFSGTVTNPTINIQHDWYSPLNPLPGGVPIASSNNTISVLSGTIPPGVYTLQTTNLVNGCKSLKTVTVTSLDAWPTFNIGSSTNFSVGCAPLNSTTLSIINPVSTQTPTPATCSYTFLAPTFTGVVSGSVILGSNTSTVFTIPGTWTVIVQDNSNFCRSSLVIPIIQNTVAPNVSASMLTQTLTCYNPTVLATGTTTTQYADVTWVRPFNPPTVSTSTLVLGPPNGPNTSTTALTYANYTVVAQNSVNACTSTSVITISQNFRPPVSSPTISIGTPTAIYCNAGSNPAILTTGSSTTTSGGGPTAYVANPCWEAPSPLTPTCGPSTYSAFIPGTYTLTVTDNYNGCTHSQTVNLLDRTQPPVLTNPVSTSTLDCGRNGATLDFATTGSSVGGNRYLVNEYPSGAAFTPSDAIVFNVNPDLSGTKSPSVDVSLTGIYQFVVTNTLTGCSAYGTVAVTNGTMTADFEPSVIAGYAPLDVTFSNLSSTSLGTGSINSIWSLGNGAVVTNTNGASVATTYTAPGTYTVMLVSGKGTCLDTSYKIIRVDIPSKLEIPNVFTPNNDGSNDIFFLRASNLTEVTALIFDRWGNKVYDVTSTTGNIGWDGKSLNGKDCPSGTYFYVIKATGKDGKEYETKGNVSLYR
jgi:gliding motility-associated-like protein